MSVLAERWVKGRFRIHGPYGKRRKNLPRAPALVEVAGYVNGPFGIDNCERRPAPAGRAGPGWVLSERRHSYLLAVFPTLRLAKLCAAEIAPRHAWERIGPGRKTGKRWEETAAIIRRAEAGPPPRKLRRTGEI